MAAGDDEGAALPDCPLDALESADGPVEVTLWYGGLNGSAKVAMDDLVAGFNASQDDVVLNASNQGADYAEVYRKYTSAAAAGTDQLPDMIYLEDTQLQAMADSGQVLPAQACMEADDYDLTALEPAVRSKYSVDDVLYPGYMNVSTPVLYYNKAHWQQAGSRPRGPARHPRRAVRGGQGAEGGRRVGQAVLVQGQPVVLRDVAHRRSAARWSTTTTAADGLATEATFDTPEAEDAHGVPREDERRGPAQRVRQHRGRHRPVPGAHHAGLVDAHRDVHGVDDHPRRPGRAPSPPSRRAPTSTPRASTAASWSRASAPFPGIEAAGQVYPSGGAFYMLNTSEPAEQAASWKFLQYMLEPENAKTWHIQGGYLPDRQVRAARSPRCRRSGRTTLAGVLLKPAVEQLATPTPTSPAR